MRTLLFTLILLPLIALAQNESGVNDPSKIDPTKVEADIRDVKNQEVEKFLLDNPEMRECQNQAGIVAGVAEVTEDMLTSARDCFNKKLNDLPEDQLKSISGQLNLEGYGVVKDNSAKSIKEYFDQRLGKALYGKNYKTGEINNLKDINFVDHMRFVELYESQISKNFLLDLSKFCLNEVEFDSNNKASCLSKKDPRKMFKDGEDIRECFKPITVASNDSKLEDFVNQLKTGGTQIESLHKEWLFCVQAISPLCKQYQKDAAETEVKTVNLDAPDSDEDDKDKVARRACIALTRMKEYRRVIAKIEDTKKELGEVSSSQRGFVNLFKQVYDGKDDTSIDSLTNITSSEMAEAMKTYNSDTKTAELKRIEECKQDPKKCQDVVTQKTDAQQDQVILEFEGRTMAKLKQIEKLDKDAFKEYLSDTGKDKLAEEIDNKTDAEIQAMRKEIMDDFRKEHLSILNELKERMKTNYEIVKDDSSHTQKIQNIENEVKNKEENLKRLYHYNNIVTSLLTVNSDSGSTQNTSILQKEIDQYKGDNPEDYFRTIGAEDIVANNSNSNQQSTTQIDLGLVDKFLSTDVMEEEKPAQ